MKRCVVAVALLICAAVPARADDRAAVLVRHFERFCLQKPPSFQRIDDAAAKLDWHVHSDSQPSLPDGQTLHSKSWYMKDATGIYELGIGKADSGGQHTETCGIGAPDIEGGNIRDELVKALKLGEPLKTTDSADGQRLLTFWKTASEGTPVTIMLTYDKAAGSQGMFLNAYVRSNGGN